MSSNDKNTKLISTKSRIHLKNGLCIQNLNTKLKTSFATFTSFSIYFLTDTALNIAPYQIAHVDAVVTTECDKNFTSNT